MLNNEIWAFHLSMRLITKCGTVCWWGKIAVRGRLVYRSEGINFTLTFNTFIINNNNGLYVGVWRALFIIIIIKYICLCYISYEIMYYVIIYIM